MQHDVDALRRKHNNHPVSPDSLLLRYFHEEHGCVLRFFVNLLVFTLRRKNHKFAIPIMILRTFSDPTTIFTYRRHSRNYIPSISLLKSKNVLP